MPDTPDLRSVVEAAEQAAAAGDYGLAEQLLRELARLQETRLGAFHPDLANTLNNLGVVCEIIGKPVDAERYFRQAWAIAAAALAPDHPFVATSRRNLEDFCAARGKALDRPTPAPVAAAASDAGEAVSADRQAAPPSYEASRTIVSGRRFRWPAIGAVILGGLFVAFIAFMTSAAWFRSPSEPEPSPRRPSASSPGRPAPAASPSLEPMPIATPDEIAANRSPGVEPTTGSMASAASAGGTVGESSSTRPAAGEPRATPASTLPPPVVIAAQLCEELSTAGRRGASRDWRCMPPSLPVGPGPLYFYTRLESPTDATVQHRWYRGDRLRAVVELRIRANTRGGYRTYSRHAVGGQDAGEGRVELRTESGILLHEERFVVR